MNVRGALAIAIGAGMWGLFWIPLRYLNDNGIQGFWAVALTLVATILMAMPLALWKDKKLFENFRWFCLMGFCLGFASVLYFAALIFTDVVRVVFLFYLLPVWATLMSRIFYGTPITGRQFLAIPLGLFGLYLLLGGDGGVPLPNNLGDWFALISGVLWGACLTLLRGNPDLNPYSASAAPFLFGGAIAVVFALALPLVTDQQMHWSSLNPPDWKVIAVVFGFVVVLIWPSMFAQVWGARLVPSSTAALLTMSEIVVALLSAWLLIGTALSPISMAGGAIIVVAALLDLSTPSPA